MCDCESPEVWSESYPKARIAHKCCECDRQIDVGVTYRLMKGLWDGCWATYKMCLECEKVSDTFHRKGGCHCIGGLYEELIDSDILLRDEETWIEQESWLKIVSQNPLRCEVVEEVEEAA